MKTCRNEVPRLGSKASGFAGSQGATSGWKKSTIGNAMPLRQLWQPSLPWTCHSKSITT
jgi:hypothetical protein